VRDAAANHDEILATRYDRGHQEIYVGHFHHGVRSLDSLGNRARLDEPDARIASREIVCHSAAPHFPEWSHYCFETHSLLARAPARQSPPLFCNVALQWVKLESTGKLKVARSFEHVLATFGGCCFCENGELYFISTRIGAYGHMNKLCTLKLCGTP